MPEEKGKRKLPISIHQAYEGRMNLSGKRALVTGGAVRIGRAITQALQSEGVEVVVHYCSSQAEAEALSPYTVQGDLANPALCAELIERAGPLDILINNASVFTKESLAQSTYESALRELQVNLLAPMELIRAFCSKTMDGVVVNLLDRRIRGHDTSCVPYSISKKGLAELTQLAALEYAPHVRVNAVAPGPVLPPPGRSDVSVRELAGHVPLDAMPSPEQIAEAVVFLLKAESITGQTIYVDGGQHLLGNGI